MEITELFAVEADELLRSDFLEEALKLCIRGMEKFPDYPIAYGILASIFERKGELTEALSVLENATVKFPLNKSLLNKKREFYSLHGNLSIASETKQSLDIDEHEEIIALQNQKISEVSFLSLVQNFDNDEVDGLELRSSNLKLIPGIEFTPLQVKSKKSGNFSHIKPLSGMPLFSFEQTNQFSNQTVPSIHKRAVKNKFDDGTKQKSEPEFHIMTETIAKILEQQGAYDSAIKAYTDLYKENPDKKTYFEERIEEIRNKKKM